jgi:hypothetical protein
MSSSAKEYDLKEKIGILNIQLTGDVGALGVSIDSKVR